ncbi:MAG: hypothetical protein HY301_19060 [Verrucomicrobia bacterium]|nr:hypothetical protein [Verrucomicrobiota bacterium]
MPRSAAVQLRRGQINFRMGRVAEAIADFDAVIGLDAKFAPRLWQRGVALHMAGRFEEAARQFAAQFAVEPDNAEIAAWHFLSVARARGVAAARTEMLRPSGKSAPRVPLTEILALLAGTGTVEQVLTAARTDGTAPAERDERLFLAHFYSGLFFEARGEPEKSDEQMRSALAETKAGRFLRDVASVKLKLRDVPKAK